MSTALSLSKRSSGGGVDHAASYAHYCYGPNAVEFHGTERERTIYERILARNIPPRAVIEQYEVDAGLFRNDLVRGGRSEDFYGASLRKSLLFGSRYLCVYLNDEHFVIAGHPYDAFCCAHWSTFPSPVICLPQSRVRDQSRRFRSIVEHEIVHANQALCRRLPLVAMERDDDVWAVLLGRTKKKKRVLSVSECVREVSAFATAEFEAYFLQRSRWPNEEPNRSGRFITEFTLFKGCFAQAWVDAMHRLFMGMFCNADILRAVLEGLHQTMHSLLLGLDSLEEDASWFIADQRRLVGSVASATADVGGPGDLRDVALAWSAS